MSNINFNNNNDKRTDDHGTFVDKPVRPRLSNLDFITWADMIDWGEFDLRISNELNSNLVENTYESFIEALKLNFNHLLDRIKILENSISGSTNILVNSITLSSTNIEITSAGATRTITATILPANATNSGVTWSSSNTGVATVSSSGKVTGIAPGNATITCKAKDGSNVSATCGVVCSWDNVQPTVQYTVTFNKNGGSSTAPSQMTCDAGNSITLPSYSGTKTGYIFGGWAENSAGTGATYSAGSSYTPTSNITLYAKWTGDWVTVIFNPMGGSNVQSQQVLRGGKLNIVTASSRTGYTFDGWYTEQTGGSKLTTLTPIDPGTGYSTITYYAHWTADSTSTTYYWYVGTTKPTSLSQATTVSQYESELTYTNTSGAKSHIFALTDNNHTVRFINLQLNTEVTQLDVDTTTIPGYKIFETGVGLINNGSIKIEIS